MKWKEEEKWEESERNYFWRRISAKFNHRVFLVEDDLILFFPFEQFLNLPYVTRRCLF